MEKKHPLVGAHTSAAGGVHNALLEGKAIGATVIQLFTSNQKRWDGRVFTKEELRLWEEAKEATGITHIMSHDSYLINLGAPDPENLIKSRKAFSEEIKRCLDLKLPYLNFHPGAALKEDREVCLERIVESLLLMEPFLKEGSLRLLLETTAGQGSSLGCFFEELSFIIERVKNKVSIGVCIDTCHIFAAGYDIRTKEEVEKMLILFDEKIGIEHLKAFHLNDSMKGLGSRVDRHASLGEGLIGISCFETLMQDKRTKDLPKYLETPDGANRWKEEIALLKKYYIR